MKTLYFILITLITFSTASAQTCKIKIYYDGNGNRIQRILECTSGRPAMAAGDSTVITLGAIAAKEGLDDLTKMLFKVYPNPTGEIVNVQLDESSLKNQCNITVTDITGKVLYQKSNIQQTVSTIDLKGLADGFYYIVLTRGTQRDIVKVVKVTNSNY